MKTILITGATRGIGEACAKALVERGDMVVNLSRSGSISRVHNILCDLREQSQINSIISYLISLRTIAFDAVILNAGIAIKKPVEEETLENIREHLEVNALGHFYLLQQLHKHNLLKEGCNVVNVISHRAFESDPTQPAYCASKAAQHMLMSCLAKELVHVGVQINHLNPGPVETQMNPIKEDESKFVDPHKKPEQVVPMMLFLIDQPLGGPVDRIFDLRRR